MNLSSLEEQTVLFNNRAISPGQQGVILLEGVIIRSSLTNNMARLKALMLEILDMSEVQHG